MSRFAQARLDPRAVLLAFVLAVAAAAPLFTTSAQRRDFYFFDVTVTSDTSGLTRFSWDAGQGFREEDSSVQPLHVTPRPVVYRFMMPPGTFRGFRLQPSDRAGHLTLANARIVDRRGHLVRAFSPDELKPGAGIEGLALQEGRVAFATQEIAAGPAFDLAPPSPLLVPLTIPMRLRAALPLGLGVLLAGLVLSQGWVLAALRRLLAPAGRWLQARPGTAILLAATAAVAIQAHPVIFFGRSFVSPNNGSLMLYGTHPTLPGATQAEFADTMGSDVGAMMFQHLYYPMAERDALLGHGEWPLWNRFNLGGEPLLGQGQAMAADPFNLLTILADGAAWAWDVRFLLAHELLALGLGLAAWMLWRHLPSALLVAVGAGFLGFFTFRINHPANFSVGYAPWILVCWIGLAQAAGPRREAAWLGGLLLASWIEFTSGTIKEAWMLLACLHLAGVLLLWRMPAAGCGVRRRRFLLALAAGGIFVLLSSPLWVAFFSALRHSITAYDTPQAQTLAPARFIGIFDDLFYRQQFPEEWVVAPALNALFLLGFLAWLGCPSAWRQNPAALALMLAALVPGMLAFGLVPATVIMRIPLLANIWHLGNTFSCPLLILLPLLAGAGFREACIRASLPGWRLAGGAALALAALLLAAFLLSTWGQSHPFSPFFRGYVTALALAGIALALGLRWTVRTGSPHPLAVALALGLPVLLWRHGQYLQSSFNHYAFSPGERADFHAPSAAVETLPAPGGGDPFRVIGLKTNLFPTYNVALHQESLYGVDALRSGYYLDLTSALHLTRVWKWDEGTPEESVAALLPAHDFLNVTRYLADRREGSPAFPGLQEVARRDLQVYASPTAWPRAFFTDRLATYAAAPDLAELIQHGDGHPFAATQTDERNIPTLPAVLAGRTVRPARDYRLTANTTSFRIDASGPGLAVLTEAFYPDDFQVTVDGQPAAYFRVNHAFRGVAIDRAGAHEIRFAYWPEYFTTALILGAVGLLALCGGGSWLWFQAGKKSSIQEELSA